VNFRAPSAAEHDSNSRQTTDGSDLA
jgi:hypothetical protein